jgi:DNA polymerase elongation subunit (family B)
VVQDGTLGTPMLAFESHIPYLLQFTGDNGINPMGFVHLQEAPIFRRRGAVLQSDDVNNPHCLKSEVDLLLEGICTQDLIWTQDTTNPLGRKHDTHISETVEDEPPIKFVSSNEFSASSEGFLFVSDASVPLTLCEVEMDINASHFRLRHDDHSYSKFSSSAQSQGFGNELWVEESARRRSEGLPAEIPPEHPSTQTSHRARDTVELDFQERLERIQKKGRALHMLAQKYSASVAVDETSASALQFTPFHRDVALYAAMGDPNQALDQSDLEALPPDWLATQAEELRAAAQGYSLVIGTRTDGDTVNGPVSAAKAEPMNVNVRSSGDISHRASSRTKVAASSEIVNTEQANRFQYPDSDGEENEESSATDEIDAIFSCTQREKANASCKADLRITSDFETIASTNEADHSLHNDESGAADKRKETKIAADLNTKADHSRRRLDIMNVFSKRLKNAGAGRDYSGQEMQKSQAGKDNSVSLDSAQRVRFTLPGTGNEKLNTPETRESHSSHNLSDSPGANLARLNNPQTEWPTLSQMLSLDATADNTSVRRLHDRLYGSPDSLTPTNPDIMNTKICIRPQILAPLASDLVYSHDHLHFTCDGDRMACPSVVNTALHVRGLLHDDSKRTVRRVGGRTIEIRHCNDLPPFGGSDLLSDCISAAASMCDSVHNKLVPHIAKARCLLPTFLSPKPSTIWQQQSSTLTDPASHKRPFQQDIAMSKQSQVATPPRTCTPHLQMKWDLRPPLSGESDKEFGDISRFKVLSIEILCCCRAKDGQDLLPNPKFDPVLCIAWDLHDSLTSPMHEVARQSRGLLCVASASMRNLKGLGLAAHTQLAVFDNELDLLLSFAELVERSDPDVLTGYEVQRASLGYIIDRGSVLGLEMLKILSVAPTQPAPRRNDFDTYAEEHESGIFITGRIVLNLWRRMRAELKLNSYSLCAVSKNLLKQPWPHFSPQQLLLWYNSPLTMYRALTHLLGLASVNQELLKALDLVRRTSESARLYGIDFFSVLTRGSQYHVEAALLKAAHRRGFILLSPNKSRVAGQAPLSVIPLVMEPLSQFYGDPVVVLDFQSLYPSMMIAYNLCFSTIIGSLKQGRPSDFESSYDPYGCIDTHEVLGVISYPERYTALATFSHDLLSQPGNVSSGSCDAEEKLGNPSKGSRQPFLSPNGTLFCRKDVRLGILPQMLKEILETRQMVKRAMKRYAAIPRTDIGSSSQGLDYTVLQRVLDARQLSIKLLANVIYGYTAASFSGRMPMSELADAIVQCARSTLEHAISVVNSRKEWAAHVVYGDTDSMFVHLPGRSKDQAIIIGQEIARTITAMNPPDVILKFEKVYFPCILASKKRYVGAAYESPDQESHFDAKGTETIRRWRPCFMTFLDGLNCGHVCYMCAGINVLWWQKFKRVAYVCCLRPGMCQEYEIMFDGSLKRSSKALIEFSCKTSYSARK